MFPLKRREPPKKKTAEAMFGVEEAQAEAGPSEPPNTAGADGDATDLADALRARVEQVGSVDPISDFRDMTSRGLVSEGEVFCLVTKK